MHTGLSSGVARYRDFIALISQANIETIIAILLPEANPDFLSSIPIFDNFLFKIRTSRGWGDTLSKLGFFDLGDLCYKQKQRTAAELRRRILDFFPAPRIPGAEMNN